VSSAGFRAGGVCAGVAATHLPRCGQSAVIAHAVYRFLEEGRSLGLRAPYRGCPARGGSAPLRRWFQRGVVSGWACAAALRRMGRAAGVLAPTMFAWDWLAGAHMLVPEAQPT